MRRDYEGQVSVQDHVAGIGDILAAFSNNVDRLHSEALMAHHGSGGSCQQRY